jgi:hypothetical protein
MCFVVACFVNESLTIDIVEMLSLLNSDSPFAYLQIKKLPTKQFLKIKTFSWLELIRSGTSGRH